MSDLEPPARQNQVPRGIFYMVISTVLFAGVNAIVKWEVALYPVGESMVELIAGTTPDSKHARMVDAGKGGLNHICFEVENIDEALAELKAKGIPLIDEVPRNGHAGCRIAFIDPSATENCLIELAQLPADHA